MSLCVIPDDRLELTCSGNLVLYKGETDQITWQSDTNAGQNSYAVLEDDGRLVIYNEEYRLVWATSEQNLNDYNNW